MLGAVLEPGLMRSEPEPGSMSLMLLNHQKPLKVFPSDVLEEPGKSQEVYLGLSAYTFCLM